MQLLRLQAAARDFAQRNMRRADGQRVSSHKDAKTARPAPGASDKDITVYLNSYNIIYYGIV